MISRHWTEWFVPGLRYRFLGFLIPRLPRPLCAECYAPKPNDRYEKVCAPYREGGPFVSYNAKTGETTEGVHPPSGCTHKHHSQEIWIA